MPECYDLVGDVHGCYEELLTLLAQVGYLVGDDLAVSHPQGRTLVFLGDLCDRGPFNLDVFRFVYSNWKASRLLWVMGNHDHKLARWMRGHEVQTSHGLDLTVTQLQAAYTQEQLKEMGEDLLDNLPFVLELDAGALVVAHAYPKMEFATLPRKKATKAFYGLKDKEGVRLAWWENYHGPAYAVFGHYWLDDPTPQEHYCCVDTSCCRGGELTLLQWPEKTLQSTPALATYDDTKYEK